MTNKFKKITAVLMVVVVIYLTALSAVAVVDLNGTGGLKIINASDGLLLTWDEVPGAKGYRVNKYDPLTGKWSLVIGVKSILISVWAKRRTNSTDIDFIKIGSIW